MVGVEVSVYGLPYEGWHQRLRWWIMSRGIELVIIKGSQFILRY